MQGDDDVLASLFGGEDGAALEGLIYELGHGAGAGAAPGGAGAAPGGAGAAPGGAGAAPGGAGAADEEWLVCPPTCSEELRNLIGALDRIPGGNETAVKAIRVFTELLDAGRGRTVLQLLNKEKRAAQAARKAGNVELAQCAGCLNFKLKAQLCLRGHAKEPNRTCKECMKFFNVRRPPTDLKRGMTRMSEAAKVKYARLLQIYDLSRLPAKARGSATNRAKRPRSQGALAEQGAATPSSSKQARHKGTASAPGGEPASAEMWLEPTDATSDAVNVHTTQTIARDGRGTTVVPSGTYTVCVRPTDSGDAEELWVITVQAVVVTPGVKHGERPRCIERDLPPLDKPAGDTGAWLSAITTSHALGPARFGRIRVPERGTHMLTVTCVREATVRGKADPRTRRRIAFLKSQACRARVSPSAAARDSSSDDDQDDGSVTDNTEALASDARSPSGPPGGDTSAGTGVGSP